MELIALLLVCGAVVRYWYLIAAVVGFIMAAHWTRLAVDRRSDHIAAKRRREAELVASADRQHNWVMQGDPRGTYGEYPVAAA